jgi:hypothetical protein
MRVSSAALRWHNTDLVLDGHNAQSTLKLFIPLFAMCIDNDQHKMTLFSIYML